MAAEFEIWLIVIAGKATLEELETVWSLDDVDRCIAAMEFKGEMAAHAAKVAGKGAS